MEEKIVDLMKKDYGVTLNNKLTNHNLKFRANDDIFTKFRKTAKFMFRNHELTEQNILDTIRFKLKTNYAFPSLSDEEFNQLHITLLDDEERPVSFSRLVRSCTKTSKGMLKDNNWVVYEIESDFLKEKHPRDNKSYVFVSLNDTFKNRYTQGGYIWKGIERNSHIFCINLSLATGYALVYKQLQDFLPEELDRKQQHYLERLLNDSNTKKKFNAIISTHCGIEENLNNYLQVISGMTLLLKHDIKASQKGKEHAKFYQTKKNINKQTLTAMDSLTALWNKTFSRVEVDNGVDLVKLSHVRDVFSETLPLLPKPEEKAILRFRKLRNHKALGMFTPFNNTIAVDFRSAKDGDIEKASGLINIGLQSFIHEYGHYLDYNYTDGIMSISKEFRPILVHAQQETAKLAKYMTPKKLDYYSLPTEIFARAFEIYISNCGLDNSLIADKQAYSNAAIYHVCDEEAITAYFDKMFPEIRTNIENLKAKTETEKASA